VFEPTRQLRSSSGFNGWRTLQNNFESANSVGETLTDCCRSCASGHDGL
jgi:hypothetical protein